MTIEVIFLVLYVNVPARSGFSSSQYIPMESMGICEELKPLILADVVSNYTVIEIVPYGPKTQKVGGPILQGSTDIEISSSVTHAWAECRKFEVEQ